MSPINTGALVRVFPPDSAYSKDYGWAAIAGTIILGLGKEPEIRELAEKLISQTQSSGRDAQLAAIRKLREALLKASPLVGFPRSINGLSVLRTTLQEQAPQLAEVLEDDKSMREPVSLEERRKCGREFFGRIYAQHTERVLDNMNKSSGGDLGEFALNCIYGDLVAETSILGAMETGMLEFVACVTLMAVPQAKGHMYGAHNLGNSGAEIRSAVNMVESISKQLSVSWSDAGMDFLDKTVNW